MKIGGRRVDPQTIGFAALIVLLAATDGAGTARTIWKMVAAHHKRKSREREKDRQVVAVGYETMKVVLSRLRKDGLVENTGNGLWKIAARGKELLAGAKAREEKLLCMKNAPRDTVVIFDVPEKEEKKRVRLRFELLALGFTMLQKSVWIGPGPIPKEFIDYLRQAKLFPHVHIFSIKKRGTVSSAVGSI